MAQVEQTILVRIIANTKGLHQALATSQHDMKQLYTASGKLDRGLSKNFSTGKRLGFSIRRLTHGMRGFRMEMLGVMFFGMGLQKFFSGLLRPAMDLVGVFDIFKTTLGILFLPVAMMFLDWALKFLDFVLDMSPETKKLVGRFVLFGVAIGGLLFLFGMFALGIGSIILAFGSLITIVVGILAGGAILTLIGHFKGFDGIGDTIRAVKDKVAGLWDKIKESKIMGSLIEALGVKVEEGQLPWDALTGTVKKWWNDLRAKLGLSKADIESWKESLIGEDGSITKVQKFWVTLKDTAKNMFDKIAEWLGLSEGDWDTWAKALIRIIEQMWYTIGQKLEDLAFVAAVVYGGAKGFKYGASVGGVPGGIVTGVGGAFLAGFTADKVWSKLFPAPSLTDEQISNIVPPGVSPYNQGTQGGAAAPTIIFNGITDVAEMVEKISIQLGPFYYDETNRNNRVRSNSMIG